MPRLQAGGEGLAAGADGEEVDVAAAAGAERRGTMTHLSPHFTLEELTASATAAQRHIENVPGETAVHNLRRLAFTLEEVRELLGCALLVSSGYRCPTLNAAVGGARTSAHPDGRAADLRPATGTLEAAFGLVKASPIPYDQVIIERTQAGAAWIHLGIAREGERPRRQALSAGGASGAMTYTRIAEG